MPNAKIDQWPTPWSLEPNARRNFIDANGKYIGSCFVDGASAVVVEAVNNIDSWRGAYIKARTERNAFLLERDRLRDIVRRLITIRENLFWCRDERTGLMLCGTTIDEDEARRTVEEARAAIGEDPAK